MENTIPDLSSLISPELSTELAKAVDEVDNIKGIERRLRDLPTDEGSWPLLYRELSLKVLERVPEEHKSSAIGACKTIDWSLSILCHIPRLVQLCRAACLCIHEGATEEGYVNFSDITPNSRTDRFEQIYNMSL